jgi:PmbA protein
MIDDLLTVAADAVALARKKGATSADALAVEGRSTEINIENGKVEKLEQSESRDIGLRVFVGESSANITGSVFERAALETMVERVIEMAKLAPPDPHAGIAEEALLAADTPDLDQYADETMSAAQLRAMAEEMEQVALAIPGVTKSSGSGASAGSGGFGLVTSNGFSRGYMRGSVGLGISVISGSGTAMERDYDGHAAIYLGDLETPEKIGRTAGERAVRRMNPRKVNSQALPIIYDRRVATSLIGHMLGAINGASIARGTSFLKDDLGKPIFNAHVTITDDPHRMRGLSSRPFDGEGLPTQRRNIIDKGVLPNWILDLRSARKLGLKPTGQASRGLGSPPSPSTSNITMHAGEQTVENMIKSLTKGLLVTEFIGSTINPVTGDYSRGASGYWIENGEIAFPVSEITIAGNLRAMYKQLTPAADLIIRGSSSAPSCLVEGMTIAGK